LGSALLGSPFDATLIYLEGRLISFRISAMLTLSFMNGASFENIIGIPTVEMKL